MQNDNNFHVQDVLHYKRKSFKRNPNGISIEAYASSRREDVEEDLNSPRNEREVVDSVGCSCDIDTDGEIANILHKKCPVITLAQQQLKRLLDETDNLLSDNIRCCRSTYDFLMLCKEYILDPNKCRCIFIILIFVTFFIGLTLGAATCGTCLRQFNSPILTCIDNFFIFDAFSKSEDSLRAVV